jgi:Peptidase A4 family
MGTSRQRNFKSRTKPASARPLNQLRPYIEQLETRLTPSVVGLTTSLNWSGYAAEQGSNLNSPTTSAVTAVGGTWVVPSVTGSTTGYSSDWVGIDGFNSNSVEQIGTEEDVVVGRHGKVTTSDYAWYEMYPSGSVEIPNFNIKAGDTISAEVSYQSTSGRKSSFTLTITDVTENESFTTTQSIPTPARSSAEWIVEAPSSSRGVLPLDNFGTVQFTGAWATLGGTTGAIDNSAWSAIPIDIGTSSTHQDTTSVPPTDSTTPGFKEAAGNSSSAFTVTFGNSPPNASSPGKGGKGQRAVNLPTTPVVNGATLIVAAAAKPMTPPAEVQPAVVVAPAVAPSTNAVALATSTASIQTVPFRGGNGDQGSLGDDDGTSEGDSNQGAQQQRAAPAPKMDPIDSAAPAAAARSAGESEQSIDTVFTGYGETGAILISDEPSVPQATRLVALTGVLLVLGMRNKKQPESESSTSRSKRELLESLLRR